MEIFTENYLADREYETLGMARGDAVVTRSDGTAEIGFEYLNGYNQVVCKGALIKARNKAQEMMVQDALDMGADAIIHVREGNLQVTQKQEQYIIYGTAIKYL